MLVPIKIHVAMGQ